MKKNIKQRDSKYFEDAKRYNELYDAAQLSIANFNELSSANTEASDLLKIAEADVEHALKAHKDASAELHATARYIEVLKREGANLDMLNGAYKHFYDCYNKEQSTASDLEIARSRVIQHMKKKEIAQKSQDESEKQVKAVFEKFYEVAKMIERKYGLNTNKNKLLKMSVDGEESADLEGVEKL